MIDFASVTAAVDKNLPSPLPSNALDKLDPGSISPFQDILKDSIDQIGALENQARAAAVGLMTGNGVDVHQAVIAAQKADMAFELALSIRNKAVQAYQSVMGMQF